MLKTALFSLSNRRYLILKRSFMTSLLLSLVLSLLSHQTASANAENSDSPSIPSAQRIISLAPHITEMLYSAGAGNKIVGVVNYSDYPNDALTKPIIGGYNAINLEKVIELNPDLILGWESGNRLQDMKRLKELGFKLSVFEVKTLDDIPDRIEQLGVALGSANQAKQKASELRNTLKTLRQVYQSRVPVSSFYQIWHKPLITMNGDQFISQAMDICGAKNVFSDLPKLTAKIGLESLFQRDPQLFLIGGEASFQQDWLKTWQGYPNLKAIKNNQIYLLNNSHYQRPTARLINHLEDLCLKVDQARIFYQKQ